MNIQYIPQKIFFGSFREYNELEGIRRIKANMPLSLQLSKCV